MADRYEETETRRERRPRRGSTERAAQEHRGAEHAPEPGRSPDMIAYSVREGADGTNYWNRVGAVWSHGDGKGSEVILESIPVDGRITLREQRAERLQDLERARNSAPEAAPARDRNHERGR